ncbi:MAG: ABC transporter ATP-binding protein [Anaerolineaceae bacterium]|nr:ABC transporter ATP-binding protein [Anaerolineaceae bacterium]
MSNQSRSGRGTSSSAPRRGPGGPPGGPGGPRIENAKDFRGTMLRLFKYFADHKLTLVVVTVMIVIYTLLGLVGPYLLGRALDEFIGNGDIAGLGRIALMMLAAYIGSAFFQFLSGYVMAKTAQDVLKTIREELFIHIQKLSLRFFDANQAGDLMSRLTNDIDAINRAVSQNVTQLISNLLTLVGVVVVMLVLNVWLTLASFVIIPLMFYITGRLALLVRRNFRELQEKTGVLNAVMEETISGQRAVKVFQKNEMVMNQFDAQNQEVRDISIRANTLTAIMMPMMTIMSNMDIAMIVGVGGWLAVKGLAGVSVGLIASFTDYNRRFTQPLRSMADLYNSLQSALAGAERVFKVLDTDPELVDHEGALAVDDIRGDVVFENVDFSYVSGVPVMKKVSLQAKAGETIALVGPTGAGKTTAINLLTRFYDIDDGAIYIDGNEIKTLKKDDLRRSLGIVLQDNFLFSGTVMENIRYGRLDATDEEVYRAAELANADQFIHRLPQGYNTELSERASNLSQGQRQLISIARAILADPKILILDEATSSVDTRTEVHIQEALLRLMEGRTAFVIAHRLSTIRNADQVLVINHGEIIERGTHHQLLAQKGFYYNLYMSQFKGKTADELGMELIPA